MGAADAATKEFMKNRQNFADAFNQGLFHKNIIDPEKLRPLNADLVTGVFRKGGKRVEKEIERILDDARLAEVAMQDNKATYLMLGSQYQQNIHYAMPVRGMMDTAQLYAGQVREISSINRDKSGLNSDEFLSGITAEDRLYPVIILVIYFGAAPWDGPKSLHEMLSTSDDEILRYCCDYKLNLLTPEDIVYSPEHADSQFNKLMRVIAAGHKGRRELINLSEDKSFQYMHNDTVRAVNTILGTNIRLNKEKGGYVNMCKAMIEINEEIAAINSQLAEKDTQLAEQSTQLAEQSTQLAEQSTQLAEQSTQLAEQSSQLAEKDRKIAEYLEMIEKLQAQLDGR